jgi:hypothetical protein
MTWWDNLEQMPEELRQRRAEARQRAHGQCEDLAGGKRCPKTGTELAGLQWLCHDHAKTRHTAGVVA